MKFVTIPLTFEDGTESSSPCSFEEALWVSSSFGMTITTKDGLYKAIKLGD